MARLCKLVIGIRPAKRMFRIMSISGAIVDALVDSVGEKDLPDDYFTRVTRTPDGAFIRLTDANDVNVLSVDTENIIFTKDYYEEKAHINFDDVQKEFRQVWDACQAVLKVRNIRRIGMVGEYRVTPKTGNSSAALLEHLTKLEARGHPAKFMMQFENRSLVTGAAGLPDVKTSDFWNTIETYYDSALDTEHSEEGQITAMLDVQRYFAPHLNGGVPDEVWKLRKRFDDATKQMTDRLAKLGLTHASEKG